VLATTQQDWSTAQIIAAYRGQARVERTFRDLKLVVHAFIAVLSLLLGRLLLRRAQRRVRFSGTVRSLMEKLAQIRLATVIEPQPGKGRPRVRTQREDCRPELTQLAEAPCTSRK
jgi:hypothetical protein